MSADIKKRVLGRGLEALFPLIPGRTASQGTAAFVCPVEHISPNPTQPRRHFAPEALQELAHSIRQHGLLEPLIVRRVAPGSDRFELIAGERRWRASQQAGLTEVMVVLKEVSPQEFFEMALIENVQREDLSPVELAEALDRLVHEYGYTQETLADRIGKSRSTVANSLRLLKLPAKVRTLLLTGALSEGHGRALLGLSEPALMEQLAEEILAKRLSVRATEALVRSHRPEPPPPAEAPPRSSPPGIRQLAARLSHTLGASVSVRDQGGRGEIVIPYANLDALDQLLTRLIP